MHWRRQGRFSRATNTILHRAKFKNTYFVDTMIPMILRDLHISLNQPPGSADD